MLGLVTTPGQAHTTTVEELPDPSPAPGELLLKALEGRSWPTTASAKVPTLGPYAGEC